MCNHFMVMSQPRDSSAIPISMLHFSGNCIECTLTCNHVHTIPTAQIHFSGKFSERVSIACNESSHELFPFPRQTATPSLKMITLQTSEYHPHACERISPPPRHHTLPRILVANPVRAWDAIEIATPTAFLIRIQARVKKRKASSKSTKHEHDGENK